MCETTAHAYLALSAHLAGDRQLAARTAQHSRTVAGTLEAPGSAGVAALALARVFDDDAELTRARELLEPLGTWDWHRHLGLPRPVRPADLRPANPVAAPGGDPAGGEMWASQEMRSSREMAAGPVVAAGAAAAAGRRWQMVGRPPSVPRPATGPR